VPYIGRRAEQGSTAIDDPSCLDLVELEVRELLKTYWLPRGRHPGRAAVGAQGAPGRSEGVEQASQADGSARQLRAAPAARSRQAVHDADRRRLLDLRPRHRRHRPRRARAR
jgi:hypothetical protein